MSRRGCSCRSSRQASFARSRRSSRGSWPAVASRRSSTALRALPFRSFGTMTSTVTIRLPVVPSLRRTPLPATRNFLPFWVPGGIRTVTGAPRCEGTLTSAPRVSSVNVTGTVTGRSEPERPNTGCGFTCTRTYRSPAGPPRSPGAPLPGILIRWPSATPAGMRVWMVRELIARPLPVQAGQGSSTTMPRPWHSLHGSEIPNEPRFLLDWPVPAHDGQTLGMVPALAPVPRQVGQGPSPGSRSATVVPSIASPKLSVVSVSTSAPRRGRFWAVFLLPPPNTPPNRSPSRPPASPAPLRMSFRSKPPKPPVLGRVPVGTRKPPPNSERASSYSLRRFSADSTEYASEISLKRSSALASPWLESGWYLRASLRYAVLISAGFAVLATPRAL